MIDVIINFLSGVGIITFLLIAILLFIVVGVGMIIALISFFKRIIDDIKSKAESEDKE